ncbi:Sulfate adenylyltransferase subunit 2 [Serinicoccus hydrothermalis]|uniref:Sulfate adenylyltransferase subunit 2 n=1 Tax=Serinicoccus hydrothermalis TaxID=1758689 RepID=A0A1B1NEC1_9MICO|nr:Sulfate adenylyltransferase subunit 2 [Serinicoccus hydrothermalis]
MRSRRVREAGADVLRRQGLDRHAAAGGEGVLPRQGAFPGAAGRHRLRLPRGLGHARPLGRRLGVRLHVASVEQAIKDGIVVDDGRTPRNRLQIGTLLNAIEEEGYTAAFGGGRRDEEKARAKERVYSHRDEFGQWDPKNQRPELWSLYNGRIHEGEHMRVFPLSNWTELDVWDYIRREAIDIPSIYYAHQRRVFERGGMLFTESEFNPLRDGETVTERTVRFRTVGDLTLTGCLESDADDLDKIIEEVAASRITERGATRGDDKFSEAAMEDRKKEGYF